MPALEPSLLHRMSERLLHRGPDDDGYLTDGPLAMGMRRLSIIDLPGGKQPIFNETGDIGLVFNGEIYNFQELRRTLEKRGHQFHTKTDTEVIVHLYEDEGMDLVERLRGMFAFALWDRRSKSLFLGRDRIGKKPLYYAMTSSGLTFASEIKAILTDPAISRELDPISVDQYLSMSFVPQPRTIYRSIHKLEAGHILSATTDGHTSLKRYWRLNYTPKFDMDFTEAKTRLLEHIRESIRLRLVSDVPIGLLLSGGIDSTSVALIMAQESERPVETFSIGFDNIPEYDELPLADATAKLIGSNHHPVRVHADIIDLLPRVAAHMDEPFGDPSILPTYLIAQIASSSVKVVLNGDGGDEAFAGYPRYATTRTLTNIINHIPTEHRYHVSNYLLEPLFNFSDDALGRIKRKICKTLIPAHRCIFQPESMQYNVKQHLYTPEFLHQVRRHRWTDLRSILNSATAGTGDPRETIMQADFNIYLPSDLLVKMDMATMAHSIESRSPLLDHSLLEFISRIPLSYKISHGVQKHILREAMGNLLPPKILKQKKRGFGLPLRTWIRQELLPIITDTLLGPSTGLDAFLDKRRLHDYVWRIIRRTKGGEKELWSLLVFQLWHQSLPKPQ